MFIKTFKKQATLLAAASLLAFAGTASANVLINPGFESPAITSGTEYFGAGDGWTSYGDWGGPATINTDTDAQIDPHGGAQMLKAFGPSGVWQEFAVNAGDVVDGSGWAANDGADPMNDNTGPSTAGVNVEWFSGGVNMNLTAFGSTIDGSTTNIWEQVFVNATAPAGADTARFVFYVNTTAGAPKLDDASFTITAVPVPAAAWLFGSALAGLVVARRKK